MGVMDKFLGALHLENEEDYDEDFYDEGDIEDNVVRKPSRRDDYSEPVERTVKRQSQKVTPIRPVRKWLEAVWKYV
jgi:hypothetical protein